MWWMVPPNESQCKEKMDETTYFYNIISLKKDGNQVQKLEEPTCEITYGKDNYCPKTISQEFPTTKKSIQYKDQQKYSDYKF